MGETTNLASENSVKTEELLNKIEALSLENKNALAIHDMICHEYGMQMVISFHLEVPSQLKLSNHSFCY